MKVAMVDVFCIIYKNRIMKSVKIVLKRRGGMRENGGGRKSN
jgi:hypothetical protein